MFDLEYQDIYVPNTKVIRNLLESLNYKVTPISNRTAREPINYKSICFIEWVRLFDSIKEATNLYYSMDKPTLTEDQSIFLFNILHVCPDYDTFKEALHQYINNPLE